MISFDEVFVGQKRRLCYFPACAQQSSSCLLPTRCISNQVLLLADFLAFFHCFNIDLTGKPPISFVDDVHWFKSRLRICLTRSLYNFHIAGSLSLLGCSHFVLFIDYKRNVACWVDHAKSFDQTLENLWSQTQILFKCCLYSSCAGRKMELYFYIVSLETVLRIQYFEQGTSPSFEVLAYPILHIRFYDH